VEVATVVDPGDLAQLFFGMRVKIAARALQRVCQKNFGCETRSGDRFLFQQFSALEKSGQNGQAASPC
jgi:hypothetical protein